MVRLRVRALAHKGYPFFRRAGRTFPVGADVVDDFDEATEALLLAEVERLKVERVSPETPAVVRPPPPPAPSPGPAPRPEFETAADGTSVPMVGGAAKGSRRS